MNIKKYLDENNIKATEFANLLGSSAMAVNYWISGKRKPSERFMQKILEVTGGKVQPNDFFTMDDNTV